jgi:hypothetical protein
LLTKWNSRASVHETPVITLRKKSKKTRSVNDTFANRIFLGGLPVSTTGSNIGDTGEAQEPAQSGPINSARWPGTAPTSGIVNFDPIGSDFDTYLSDINGICAIFYPHNFSIKRRVNLS